MKFFRSEAQLSNFKHATGCCLPGVLRRLSCFRGLAATQHHRIKESTELRCTSYNPGIVAKLMGLESIPQRITSVHRQQDHRNSNSRSQSISKTPMVLELEKRKFFILGLEAGCKGEEWSWISPNSQNLTLEIKSRFLFLILLNSQIMNSNKTFVDDDLYEQFQVKEIQDRILGGNY